MTVMALNDLYRSLLREGFLAADDEGFISIEAPGAERHPALIKGDRLVLPTPNQLAVVERGQRLFFHPLRESAFDGPSEVLTFFREMVNTRLNIVLGVITVALLRKAASVAEHTQLQGKEQTDLLVAVKDATNKTIATFKKIVDKSIVSDSSKAFVHIYVRKGAELNGKKHQQVAVVTFPFYEELKKPVTSAADNRVFGIKLDSMRDRETLIRLMEYILPGIGEDRKYYRGIYDSKTAPQLEALMAAVRAVGTPINHILELFEGPIFSEDQDLKIGGEWEAAFDDLTSMRMEIAMVPELPGNEGAKVRSHAKEIHIPQAVTIPATPAAPGAPQPMAGSVPVTPATYRAPPKMGEVINDGKYLPAAPKPSTHAPVSSGLHVLPPVGTRPDESGSYAPPAPPPPPPMLYGVPQPMPPQGYNPAYPPMMPPGYPPGSYPPPQGYQPPPYGYPMPPQGYPQPPAGNPGQLQTTERGIDPASLFAAHPELFATQYQQPGYYPAQAAPPEPSWAAARRQQAAMVAAQAAPYGFYPQGYPQGYPQQPGYPQPGVPNPYQPYPPYGSR